MANHTVTEYKNKPDKLGASRPTSGWKRGGWKDLWMCTRTTSQIVWKRWKEHDVTYKCYLNVVTGFPEDEPTDDDDMIYHGLYWKNNVTKTTPWVNKASQGSRPSSEIRLFDPPTKLFDWDYAVAPDIISGTKLLIHTAWLRTIPEIRTFNTLIDGQPYKGDMGHKAHWIDTSTLRKGMHTFDLHVLLKSGKQKKYQVMFSIIHPFNAQLEIPVLDMPLNDLIKPVSKTPNTVYFTLVLKNNTNQDQLLSATPTGVPSGWMANVLGPHVFKLKARKTKRLRIPVELMTDVGLHDGGLQPMTITIYSGIERNGALHNATSVTGYVRPLVNTRILSMIVKRNKHLQHTRTAQFYTS